MEEGNEIMAVEAILALLCLYQEQSIGEVVCIIIEQIFALQEVEYHQSSKHQCCVGKAFVF